MVLKPGVGLWEVQDAGGCSGMIPEQYWGDHPGMKSCWRI